MKKINISDKSYEVIKFSKLHNRKWNWDTWSNYYVWKIVIKSNSLDIDYVMRRRVIKSLNFS